MNAAEREAAVKAEVDRAGLRDLAQRIDSVVAHARDVERIMAEEGLEEGHSSRRDVLECMAYMEVAGARARSALGVR